jgi:hypothetical protein
MTDQNPVGDQQPRWVRRDSQRACFVAGAVFVVLAIVLPVFYVAGKEWTAFGTVVLAILEAAWIVLAQAYLRTGFYKRSRFRQ